MELLDEPRERKWLFVASVATLAVSAVALIAIRGALLGYSPHSSCRTPTVTSLTKISLASMWGLI
jgi:hypothetical protein